MMSAKLQQYQGCVGRLHELRSTLREKYSLWKENNPHGLFNWIKNKIFKNNSEKYAGENYEDFSHVYRRKTKNELVRISAAVMGIEFSYAAETAFVSPTLLKIGIEHKHMTLIWALSPLLGFFLTPILGSLSDRCQLKIGRRRPFILVMSVGLLMGLILVPNGELLGYVLGDEKSIQQSDLIITEDILNEDIEQNTNAYYFYDSISNNSIKLSYRNSSHYWGAIMTILGTVLLDFDADAMQSPARAYLLDVTVSDDHARGLSTFTIMAGLGGFFGYALGGINWDVTILGSLLGGHVRAVFTCITVIFVICVTYTITSFKEIPLYTLESNNSINAEDSTIDNRMLHSIQDYGSTRYDDSVSSAREYLTLDETEDNMNGLQDRQKNKQDLHVSILLYLKSIIYMPHSIKMLCITNLFCWMAHVCYSLYFTDFVGEAVFEGNPVSAEGSVSRELYESGVRFGCWGMSMYSLSCACYSTKIENFIKIFGAKKVYIGGLLTYSIGMLLMAITKNQFGVIVFSWTAGVMYSTLFTMPYLIIAHYHDTGIFDTPEDEVGVPSHQIRGLGTDVAIISSMVFLAQFILSLCMGSIVNASGTTTAVIYVACTLALCGAISASQIVYLDL